MFAISAACNLHRLQMAPEGCFLQCLDGLDFTMDLVLLAGLTGRQAVARAAPPLPLMVPKLHQLVVSPRPLVFLTAPRQQKASTVWADVLFASVKHQLMIQQQVTSPPQLLHLTPPSHHIAPTA